MRASRAQARVAAAWACDKKGEGGERVPPFCAAAACAAGSMQRLTGLRRRYIQGPRAVCLLGLPTCGTQGS